MIKPISFSGIKNIGYVRVISDDSEIQKSRTAMNMELTDEGNKDLTEYRNLTAQNPKFKNNINDRFVNIEFETRSNYGFPTIMAKFNGNYIGISQQNEPVINFMHKLVNRVSKFKEKDFKMDADHHIMTGANLGLIYNEDMTDYLTGYSGRIDLLEGSGLTEKFDLYWNCEPEGDSDTFELSEEEEMVNDAMDGVMAVLHHPAYVHNGAIYMDALLKGYSDYLERAN